MTFAEKLIVDTGIRQLLSTTLQVKADHCTLSYRVVAKHVNVSEKGFAHLPRASVTNAQSLDQSDYAMKKSLGGRNIDSVEWQ